MGSRADQKLPIYIYIYIHIYIDRFFSKWVGVLGKGYQGPKSKEAKKALVSHDSEWEDILRETLQQYGAQGRAFCPL